MFIPPKNANQFTNTVFQRAEKLIKYKIWQGIDKRTFSLWLRNFVNEEERYFAACVLDSVIYRSNPQTFALLRQLFQTILPNFVRENNIDIEMPVSLIDSWCVNLNRTTTYYDDPLVRLVPVINKESPTKSGYQISRFISRELQINEEWIISPDEIQNSIVDGVKLFVFFDDFVGTGYQFRDFIFEHTSAVKDFDEITFVYAPLVAHVSGIQRIQSSYPHIKVVSVESLNNSHSLFNVECNCFNDEINSVADAKKFYREMIDSKGLDFSGYRDGFGELELAYGFEHAAPDNCLPILWWHKDPTLWKPLFKR